MAKFTVAICRFPYLRSEDPDVTDWYASTYYQMRCDSRIERVFRYRIDETPVTMSRNLAIRKAQACKADYLLIVDSDMSPDAHLLENPFRPGDVEPHAGAKLFWDTAWEFMMQQRQLGKPCVIAAPYCGRPPHEVPFIFAWRTKANLPDETDLKLEVMKREEVVNRAGIEEVAALPTGLMLIDMRAVGKSPTMSTEQVLDAYLRKEITKQAALRELEHGWFYYQWSDGTASQKVSTEDVTFTRDLSMDGVPLYVAWDCWAGHWKHYCVVKPRILAASLISERMLRAKERGIRHDEQMVMVGEG